MIELHEICKTYPGNRRPSLSQANWSIRRGGIHAILGENGAGKSTLMHILSGFLRPDSGEIRINGTVTPLNSVQAARRRGIGMVRQRPEPCPDLRVWEGCVLSKYAHGRFLFSPKAERERAGSCAARFNLKIPLDARTSELSDGERHTAAILSLLLCDTDCLIFDEPSAVLNETESSALEQLYNNLKHKGRAIALITHKIEEALAIADTITVMRNGCTAATRPAQDWSKKDLITGMFGAEPVYAVPPPSSWRAEQASSEEAGDAPPPPLSVRNLDVTHNGTRLIRRLNLAIAAGEITGVVGRKEDGLEALELAVCGFVRPSSGEIVVAGGQVDGNPAAFRTFGGAFMASAPRRLKETGIAGCDRNLSIYDNLIIHQVGGGGAVPLFRFAVLEKMRLSRSPDGGAAPLFRFAALEKMRLSRSPDGGAAPLFRFAVLEKMRLSRSPAGREAYCSDDNGSGTHAQGIEAGARPLFGFAALAKMRLPRSPAGEEAYYSDDNGNSTPAQGIGAEFGRLRMQTVKLERIARFLRVLPQKCAQNLHFIAWRRELGFFVETIKERARIRVRSKRRLGVLSGGMLQRLMLEREIESSKPGSLLVISQALWGLDFEQRRRLGRKIQCVAETGRGVLLFAASTEEAAALCTRVLTLKNGVLTGAGGDSGAGG